MNLVICGFGRAGKSLAKTVLHSKDNQLELIICRKNSANVNKDIGQMLDGCGSGIRIVPIDKAADALKGKKVDAVIDFSHHDMTEELLQFCEKIHSPLVVCTTNHTVEQVSQLRSAADTQETGVVYCPNLTVGINLIMNIVKKIADVYPEFDFDILEKHPKDKKQPTETARNLARNTGDEKTPIHSVRMDGYIGVHQIVMTDGVERITLTHESLSRQAFAKGAILAAEFIQGKKGFFQMTDVIHQLERAKQD